MEFDVVFTCDSSVTIRGARRRTTVPKKIVDALDLKDKDVLRWALLKDGSIVVKKVE